MGNAIKSWGEYPPEYNRAVHGFYHPSVYYGKKDTPFGDVKLGELPQWFARRNKSPRAIVRAISRAFWRHDLIWMAPKKPGMVGLYQKIFLISAFFFILITMITRHTDFIDIIKHCVFHKNVLVLKIWEGRNEYS